VIKDLVLSMIISFALVATRMALFVAISPFPGPAVPTEIRVGLTLLLALTATPLAMMGHPPAIGPALVLATLGEAMTGAAIGFVFRVGMSAADVLGSTLAHATGLTFASSYDPAQAASTDSLTRLVTTAATLLMFAIGAHRVVIGAAVGSFRVVPLGRGLDLNAYLPGILQWIGRSLECGLGLALPAMVVSLVIQVALGLVARAAPSLQVFSVGLSLTLASGLFVVLAGLGDCLAGLGAHLASMGRALESILSAVG
jgi:flagellar biosynthetic protein FliR